MFTLFKRILKGARIRKRPPEKDCVTCRDWPEFKAEFAQLLTALNADPSQGDFRRWGGRHEAETRRKMVETYLPGLEQHAKWLETQRPMVQLPCFLFLAEASQVKDIENKLRANQALLFLDFGSFYDSAGGKFSRQLSPFLELFAGSLMGCHRRDIRTATPTPGVVLRQRDSCQGCSDL